MLTSKDKTLWGLTPAHPLMLLGRLEGSFPCSTAESDEKSGSSKKPLTELERRAGVQPTLLMGSRQIAVWG